MKTFASLLTVSALALCAIHAIAADDVYLAPQSIDSSTHAPAALAATDGTASKLLRTGFSAVDLTTASPLIVTATTYVPNTIVGGLISFANAARKAGGTSILRSIQITDYNTTPNKQPLTLVLFDTTTLTGTYTDHAAMTIHANDVSHVIRTVAIAAADYNAVGTAAAFADPAFNQKVLQLSGSTSLGALLLINSGTATMTGTNTMAIRIGVTHN